MNHDDFVAAIRRDGAALDVAARAAGVDAPVPSCPDWKVRDLVAHVGRIHHWVSAIVADGSMNPNAHWSAEDPPPDDELFDWYAGGYPQLADALAAAGPDAPAWTWTPDQTAGFWARRQANETSVHAYDAQLAAGTAQPVEREIAADGIDELFAMVPFLRWADRVRGEGETLHFHCTDCEGEWLVRLDPDAFVVTREHAKGDVAARGTASNLLLFLYGRAPVDQLEVFGDASLLARWRELVTW